MKIWAFNLVIPLFISRENICQLDLGFQPDFKLIFKLNVFSKCINAS